MGTALAVLVVAVVAVAIGYPLWRPGAQPPPDPIGPAATLAALEERKLQLYAAIREIGFDYRMDKLEESDYETEVERLKAEAIAVVREMDELRSRPPRGPEELEAEIAALREQIGAPGDAAQPSAGGADRESAGGLFCTQCGAPAGPDDRFCGSCGNKLRTQ